MEAMKINAPCTAESAPEQHIARVVGRAGHAWHLDLDGQRRTGARAQSCLLEPALGDRVLVLVSGGDCWVLSILDRPSESGCRLTFPGDVLIELEHGGLSVHSKKALSFSSGESFQVRAPLYSLCATTAEHFVHGVSWIGRKLVSTYESIRTVSRSIESVSDTRCERSRHSIRSVEQIDRVTSGQIDYRAEGNFAIRGQNIVAKGRELAKIDSKQIQLG